MKTIIFDFDGTLADTLPLCFHSFNTVFHQFDQKEYHPEEIKSMFGPPETEIIRNQLENDRYEEAIEWYFETYAEQHSKFVDFNKDMHQLLSQLKGNGFKLGIVTGKSRRSLDISLKELQMEAFFDVTVAGDEVEQTKPDPEGLIEILQMMDAKKEEAMFLGDSDADIEAGKRAGVFTIGVQWLPNTQVAEFAVEPDHILETVEEFFHMDVVNQSKTQ